MSRWALSAAVLLAAGFAAPAHAAPVRYEYRVVHPTYGDIGTYTNIVDREGDHTEVTSKLHIAVRLLGITVYRQDAERTELWHGKTLERFDGVTVTDGERLPVHGQAKNGGFVITTPSGTVTAPASVHPSNPWSPMVLDTGYMMSTRTGQVLPVHVRGGEVEPVALSGVTLKLHQYEVVSDKHQFVWLDDRGTPVAFRTNEHGKPVDFVLMGRQQLADSAR